MILLLLCIAFLGALIWVIKKKTPSIASYHKPRCADLPSLNRLHTVGIVVMMVPLVTNVQQPVFLLAFPDKISILQTVAFIASFGVIGFFPWKKFTGNGYVSQPDAVTAGTGIVIYGLLRVIFLISYEWFFRGMLLIHLSSLLGITGGITANILLYTMMHVHKSKNEMIACVPFGLLLCLFTILWQSIWPAFIFHVQIAVINEWPPLKQLFSFQKQATL